MFNDRNYTYSGWACTDCVMLHANGETDPGWSEEELAEYLARVERHTEGTEVTLGMFAEDHECASNWTATWHVRGSVRGSFRRGTVEVRADDHGDAYWRASWDIPAGAWITMVSPHELETESDRGGECYCECTDFSWSACDMCGSDLGGHRDAMVFWFGPAQLPDVTSDPGGEDQMDTDGAGLYAAGV